MTWSCPSLPDFYPLLCRCLAWAPAAPPALNIPLSLPILTQPPGPSCNPLCPSPPYPVPGPWSSARGSCLSPTVVQLCGPVPGASPGWAEESLCVAEARPPCTAAPQCLVLSHFCCPTAPIATCVTQGEPTV